MTNQKAAFTLFCTNQRATFDLYTNKKATVITERIPSSQVIVVDSNDNVPEFPESRYEFSVAEDAEAETVIGVIQAEDPDSGSFGEISYSIKGFGSEKFSVRELTGEVMTIIFVLFVCLRGLFTKNGTRFMYGTFKF